MEAGLPPGPQALGRKQAVTWIRRPGDLLDECSQRYGDPFTLHLWRLPPIVVLSDPGAVRDVFRGDPQVLRSGEANAALQAALGTRSLLLLDGSEHLRERRMMLPPFHGERMRAYGELMQAVAERSVRAWPAGRPFEVAPHTRGIALEVIMRAVFGVEDPRRLERLGRALRRFLDTATKPWRVFVLFAIKPGGPTMRLWRRYSYEIRPIDRMLAEEIRERREDPRRAERADILSMLLEATDEDGRPLDDEHLRDELMTLLVAGHETTATALAWAMTHLAREPAAAERAATDDAFLEAVVKETLRLHPITAFAAVRETKAPVEIGGRNYPAGIRLAPCSHLLHRRPDVYPEPHAFRPERFLDSATGTYTWIPFGGGPRRCLGASFAMFEMATVLRAVLRAGALRAPEPGPERDIRRGLTLAPARGGRVVFEPA
jgi:cytochrome P450